MTDNRRGRNVKLPSDEVLKALIERGMTYREVGEQYGTTGEAVAKRAREGGFSRSLNKPSHKQVMPWKVKANHQRGKIAALLRDYSRREQGMKVQSQKALADFDAYMEGDNQWGIPLSVHYSYDDPDGFWFEPRQPGEGLIHA